MTYEKEKRWYLKRKLKFTEVSSAFNGFGTLLIEGDALLAYTGLSRQAIEQFLSHLTESGFSRIKIIFLHAESKYTCINEEQQVFLREPQIFANLDHVVFIDLKIHRPVRVYKPRTCKCNDWQRPERL